MLKKDPKDRPDIEDIIYSEVFQEKAQMHQVRLPKILNKAKIIK